MCCRGGVRSCQCLQMKLEIASLVVVNDAAAIHGMTFLSFLVDQSNGNISWGSVSHEY